MRVTYKNRLANNRGECYYAGRLQAYIMTGLQHEYRALYNNNNAKRTD